MPSMPTPDPPAPANASEPLISIISSVYNAAPYIAQAIGSVLAQTHTRWELLVGCDGCTDDTAAIARSFGDARIRVFDLPKRGLSNTRNHLLGEARGEYFCMFDGDDVMPPRSLEARAAVLIAQPGVSFVDGAVEFRNADMGHQLGFYRPRFRGFPLPHLIALDGICFFGNTWMIRRERGLSYRFDAQLSHGEDLMFYMSIAAGRLYDHTDEVVLWYRRTGSTLMTDLRGLEDSYAHMYGKVRSMHVMTVGQRWRFKFRIIRSMVLAWLKHERAPFSALRAAFRYLFL